MLVAPGRNGDGGPDDGADERAHEAIGASAGGLDAAPPERASVRGCGVHFEGGRFLAYDVRETRSAVDETDLRQPGDMTGERPNGQLGARSQRIVVVAKKAWAR